MNTEDKMSPQKAKVIETAKAWRRGNHGGDHREAAELITAVDDLVDAEQAAMLVARLRQRADELDRDAELRDLLFEAARDIELSHRTK